MHNCVGHNNRRYFVLTLVYLWLGCVYYSLFTLTPFYQIHFLGRLDVRLVLTLCDIKGHYCT